MSTSMHTPHWFGRHTRAANANTAQADRTDRTDRADSADAGITWPADFDCPPGPETHVPVDQLASEPQPLHLTPQIQTILAGAVRLGEARRQDEAWEDGFTEGKRGEFRWGFICGMACTAVLACAAVGLGTVARLL